MICTIVDDWMDESYLHELSKFIEELEGWHFNNVAGRKTWPHGQTGTHRLMGCDIFDRTNVNRILHLHPEASRFFDMFDGIESLLGVNYFLSQIQLNLQHSGCDGTSHNDGIDPNQKTVMVMTNAVWKKEWGGQFQLLDDDGEIIEEHEYVPGRLIVFPSPIQHRGLGPNKEYPYVYRHTTVFRIYDFDKDITYIK